ncbi:PepSY domain-containing protein [Streptomyces sp. NPDC059582]|uniref:PepSY domain-containing protein n=1 Tax=Streptomyces sp. NPDC059582 TaxID=3346875 RepID=UPI0036C514AF
MKRTAAIATAFGAAVIIGGGSYSALATSGSDRHSGGREDRPAVTASPSPSGSSVTAPPSPSGSSVTAAQAAAAARKTYPGTVVKVDLDADHPGYWEVYVVGADHVRRELRVDARTGAVTVDRRGGDDLAGDDRRGHAGGDDRGRGTRGQDDRPGDHHGGATGVGDDLPGDDHGVHADGDDHGGDDHVGDGKGRGRDRGRDGHGGDDR